MTSIRSNDIPFWKRPSSFVVTAVRVVVLVLVHASPFPSWSILGDWLYSPSLTSILIKPSYTLSHVREAMAIQNLSSGRSSDAYKAHPRIQMPPLLLAALTPLAKTDHAEFYLALFCLLLDLALATMVEHIGRTALFTNRIEEVDEETKEQGQLPESIRAPNSHIFAIDLQCKDDSIISMESLPSMAAQLYYWSLVTTASGSLYACFQMLPGFFLVAAFYESLRRHGSPFLSTFLLAVATYLELHHVAFLFPLSFLPSTRNRRAFVVFTFVFWFVCLQGLSYQLTGPSMFGRVLEATYGLGWRTVRPSLSVQWYLAMQLFSRFREYFRVLLLGLPYIAVMPITTRLHKYPIVLVAIFSMLWSTFRSAETLFDANLALCFILLCPRSLARMGFASFVALCSMGVPVVLNVVDHWMWMGPNTGNANYIFFQCLAYNVFLGVLLGQFCKASLERDKALRLSAKKRESRPVSGN